MNNRITLRIFTAAFFATASLSLADTPVPPSDVTSALGAVKNGGPGKFDFKRAKHDLRLENLVMNAAPAGDGSVITGSFTMTHLYKGAFGLPIRPADHILVSFVAKDGKTETKITDAKKENPWGFILAAGATAAGAPPEAAGQAAQAATKLSGMISGDAGPFMAQAIVSLTDRLAALSKKKY